MIRNFLLILNRFSIRSMNKDRKHETLNISSEYLESIIKRKKRSLGFSDCRKLIFLINDIYIFKFYLQLRIKIRAYLLAYHMNFKNLTSFNWLCIFAHFSVLGVGGSVTWYPKTIDVFCPFIKNWCWKNLGSALTVNRWSLVLKFSVIVSQRHLASK